MVKGIRYLIFLTMALLLTFAAVPALAAPPPGYVDQSQNYHESGQILKNNFWVAQTFTAGSFANPAIRQLVNVDLMMEGNGGPATVQIRAWNGSDMGSKLGEATIPRVKWSGFYKVSFTDVKITAGQKYAIVVSSNDIKCLAHGTKIHDYANGDAFYSENSGGKWKLLKDSSGSKLSKLNDFYFKTYVAHLECYSDEELTTVPSIFDSGNNIVHVGGGGLAADAKYDVAYFDGNGNKVETHADVQALSNGMIKDKYLLTSHTTAVPGTWHVVVCERGKVPNKYKPDNRNIVLQDEFGVDHQAIPEFPAVVSSIMVVGMCAGIYTRMKKRKLSMAG